MKIVLSVVVLATASLASDICWKDTYVTGAGRGIHECPSGYEKNGLLCYPKCRSGYYGVGPVCWELCPSGWRDDGALCNNRGGWNVSATRKNCPWYDVCGLIWGKCTTCPSGFLNHGCTCHKPLEVRAKKSYGRGVGKPLHCSEDEVQHGLFCYPRCKDRDGKKFYPVKFVCWQECSGATPQSYGAACCKDTETCLKWTANLAIYGIKFATWTFAGAGVGSIAVAGATAAKALAIAGGLAGAAGSSPLMISALHLPICGSDGGMKFRGFGKCKGTPLTTLPGIRTASDCVKKCNEDARCKFASHYSKLKYYPECKLYDTCALETHEDWETFGDSEIDVSETDGATYKHMPRTCVSGHNIKLYHSKTAEECMRICDAMDECLSFEYGVDYGQSSYKSGDCQPQSSSDYTTKCGAHNLDLYIKVRNGGN